MRALFRLRLPLSLTVGVVVQGIAIAAGFVYVGSPLFPRPGWAAPATVSVLLSYLLITAAITLWMCVSRISPRRFGRMTAPVAAGRAPRPVTSASAEPITGARFRRMSVQPQPGARRAIGNSVPLRQVAVGAGFAALVLLAGGTHLGQRSGFWASSIPRMESDPSTGDGHVMWLEGIPLQEDSAPFLFGVEAMSGRVPASEIAVIGRSGRVAYSFLVSLIAPVTAAAGSMYTGFVLLNLLMWWGGAVAIYDLARRAMHAEWVGVVAGVLVATGIGFTFAAGTPMSVVAAYGSVPIVLWVMDRFGVLTARSRLTDDVLVAFLAAGAGMLNSLLPFFLCFGACYFAGRCDLRRLVLWAAILGAIGQLWNVWLGWIGPRSWQVGLNSLRSVLVVLVVVLLLFGLTRLPRRLGEAIVAMAVLALVAIALLLAVVLPGRLMTAGTVALAGLHIPEHITALVLPKVMGGGSTNWMELLTGLRLGALDLEVASAFPGPVLWLAAAGMPRLPQRWRDWAFAIIISAALTTFVQDTVTSAPHPRLMYLAYAGVYFLAAHGVANLYRLLSTAGGRVPWLSPSAARVVALTGVAVCLAAAIVPGQASLWGDWSFELMFHFQNV
jgi:hypothetical protein